MNILLAEDNRDVSTNIAEYLEPRGAKLDFAYDGANALGLAIANRYDCIVLDIMMPVIDGYEICRRLRSQEGEQTPILMLTALDSLSNKIKGFDSGADDYLIKPFELPELYARLKALCKRTRISQTDGPLTIEDLECNPKTLSVTRAGRKLKLGPIELKILFALARASPNPVTKEQLEAEIWSGDVVEKDVLRSHIYSIRRIVDKPFETALIHTIHSLGYWIGKDKNGAAS
ncbi:MAG: response regulator transcription factor [Pirellulales bacterium]|nr:response regulator transcription factor [Pirellulales bacterium]